MLYFLHATRLKLVNLKNIEECTCPCSNPSLFFTRKHQILLLAAWSCNAGNVLPGYNIECLLQTAETLCSGFVQLNCIFKLWVPELWKDWVAKVCAVTLSCLQIFRTFHELPSTLSRKSWIDGLSVQCGGSAFLGPLKNLRVSDYQWGRRLLQYPSFCWSLLLES